MRNMKSGGKRFLSVLLGTATALSLFAGVTVAKPTEAQAADTMLKNPVRAEDGSSVTWDSVYFGAYPQSEVTAESNPEVYEKLQKVEDDTWIQNNYEMVIDGCKYRMGWNNSYYWSGNFLCLNSRELSEVPEEERGYFKYEPIKWRVLNVDGDKAFLVSDTTLDSVPYVGYGEGYVSQLFEEEDAEGNDLPIPDEKKAKWPYWKNSDLRRWLNGYSTDVYGSETDYYGNKNFLDTAFTPDEQNAIIETSIPNNWSGFYKDDLTKWYDYDSRPGDPVDWQRDNRLRPEDQPDTSDRIFVLSFDEITSKAYGFRSYSSDNRDDYYLDAEMVPEWETDEDGKYIEDENGQYIFDHNERLDKLYDEYSYTKEDIARQWDNSAYVVGGGNIHEDARLSVEIGNLVLRTLGHHTNSVMMLMMDGDAYGESYYFKTGPLMDLETNVPIHTDGSIDMYGSGMLGGESACGLKVAPAMYLDLSKTDLWTYAGEIKVESQEGEVSTHQGAWSAPGENECTPPDITYDANGNRGPYDSTSGGTTPGGTTPGGSTPGGSTSGGTSSGGNISGGSGSAGGTQNPGSGSAGSVKVNKIAVSGMSKQIAAGKKITLTAKVTPSDAANKALVWSSSNTKYATVNSKGVVTTKKKGVGKTVTITARAADGSGITAKYKIKIMKYAVKSIKLKAAKTVKAGKKLQIKATVKANNKKAKKKDFNKMLSWSSSNKKYATVTNKGKVTAKKAGKGKTVKITAKATDGSNKKAAVKIKIK